MANSRELNLYLKKNNELAKHGVPPMNTNIYLYKCSISESSIFGVRQIVSPRIRLVVVVV